MLSRARDRLLQAAFYDVIGISLVGTFIHVNAVNFKAWRIVIGLFGNFKEYPLVVFLSLSPFLIVATDKFTLDFPRTIFRAIGPVSAGCIPHVDFVNFAH